MQVSKCDVCRNPFEREWYDNTTCPTCIRQQKADDAAMARTNAALAQTREIEIEKANRLAEIEREKVSTQAEVEREIANQQARTQREIANQQADVEIKKINAQIQSTQSQELNEFLNRIDEILAFKGSIDVLFIKISSLANAFPQFHENLYYSFNKHEPYKSTTINCIKSYFFDRVLHIELHPEKIDDSLHFHAAFEYFYRFRSNNNQNFKFYKMFFHKYLSMKEQWDAYVDKKLAEVRSEVNSETTNIDRTQKKSNEYMEKQIALLNKNEAAIDKLNEDMNILSKNKENTMTKAIIKGSLIGISTWIILGILDLIDLIKYENLSTVGFGLGALIFVSQVYRADEQNKATCNDDELRNQVQTLRSQNIDINRSINEEKNKTEIITRQFNSSIYSLNRKLDDFAGSIKK